MTCQKLYNSFKNQTIFCFDQARAIENQCYVVAAAQTGQHNAKRSSYGHAMILDPWGTVLAECRKPGN